MGEMDGKNGQYAKKFFRQAVLKKRDKLTPEQQLRAKILITERLLGHQWFYNSDIILGFVSYGSEIQTDEILEEALKKGKKVYVPKVEGEDIVFYRYFGPQYLEEGYKGIREPKGDTEKYEYTPEIAKTTLLIMPGVAFDPYRNRMGYGKGFYDRFLQDKMGLWIRSIAIGHKCQMVEDVPNDVHDMKPYQVICV